MKVVYLFIASAYLAMSVITVSFAQSKHVFKVDSGYAKVNGTLLYYEVAGAGKTIVLIHGSFGDRRFWDFQFKELSKKFKVVRYDIRGYGKSALPNADEVYRDCDDLNGLMDFLQIKKNIFAVFHLEALLELISALLIQRNAFH